MNPSAKSGFYKATQNLPGYPVPKRASVRTRLRIPAFNRANRSKPAALRGWPRRRADWMNDKRVPCAQSKQNAPSTTKVSPVTRNRAIAADIRATRSYKRATAADSREIGIYTQEIASYIREIASDWWSCASTSQKMAVNIEEIAGYARRNAAAAVGRLPAARFAPVSGRNPSFPPLQPPAH